MSEKKEQKPLKRAVIKQELVELTGDFRKAIVLNQMIYWSERTKDADRFIEDELQRAKMAMGRDEIEYAKKLEEVDLKSHGWIYKSAAELSKDTMMKVSKSTMRRYLDELVENGWLDVRKNPKWKGDNTLQYRVNLVKIQTDLQKLGYALEGYPLLKVNDNNNNSNDEVKAKSEKIDNENGVSNFETPMSNYETSKLHNETTRSKIEQAVLKSNGQFQNRTTLPEITTEITTENTSESFEEEEIINNMLKNDAYTALANYLLEKKVDKDTVLRIILECMKIDLDYFMLQDVDKQFNHMMNKLEKGYVDNHNNFAVYFVNGLKDRTMQSAAKNIHLKNKLLEKKRQEQLIEEKRENLPYYNWLEE